MTTRVRACGPCRVASTRRKRDRTCHTDAWPSPAPTRLSQQLTTTLGAACVDPDLASTRRRPWRPHAWWMSRSPDACRRRPPRTRRGLRQLVSRAATGQHERRALPRAFARRGVCPPASHCTARNADNGGSGHQRRRGERTGWPDPGLLTSQRPSREPAQPAIRVVGHEEPAVVVLVDREFRMDGEKLADRRQWARPRSREQRELIDYPVLTQ